MKETEAEFRFSCIPVMLKNGVPRDVARGEQDSFLQRTYTARPLRLASPSHTYQSIPIKAFQASIPIKDDPRNRRRNRKFRLDHIRLDKMVMGSDKIMY